MRPPASGQRHAFNQIRVLDHLDVGDVEDVGGGGLRHRCGPSQIPSPPPSYGGAGGESNTEAPDSQIVKFEKPLA